MRREPPAGARWMLRHLMASECREEIEGDLLEEYGAGRPDAWYWRQTLGACGVSWWMALRARLPLLLFALVWTLAAPAWELLCELIQQARMVLDLPRYLGGFWVIPGLMTWTVAHVAFLWAGALLYIAVHGTLGLKVRAEKARRGMLLAPLLFDLFYGPLFVVVNLYFYSIPELSVQRLAATSLGRITDLRLLADLIRMPYFAVLVWMLWGAIEVRPRRAREGEQGLKADGGDALALYEVAEPPFTSKARCVVFLAAAGAMNALLAGFLLCQLPEVSGASVMQLLLRAAMFVVLGVVGGVAGAWIYWNSPWSPLRGQVDLSFKKLVLECSPAWVWAPVFAVLSEQFSVAAAIAATAGAYFQVLGVRRMAPQATLQLAVSTPAASTGGEMFSGAWEPPYRVRSGHLIALALYAGVAALLGGMAGSSAILLAFAAGIYAWKRPGIEFEDGEDRKAGGHDAAKRITAASAMALVLTAWALLEVARSHALGAEGGMLGARSEARSGEGKLTANNTARHGAGFESVILYPFPEQQKRLTVPLDRPTAFVEPGRAVPLTIRFSGTYRYVQPPDTEPGPHAHRVHGSPLTAHIVSSDAISVMMDAHQWLATPVRAARCGAIEVQIANGDNLPGRLQVAVLLTDGENKSARTLYLGQQPIVSTETGYFAVKAVPVHETLRFAVPTQRKLEKFDQITVLILPDIEHAMVAPKIVVEEFRLLGR